MTANIEPTSNRCNLLRFMTNIPSLKAVSASYRKLTPKYYSFIAGCVSWYSATSLLGNQLSLYSLTSTNITVNQTICTFLWDNLNSANRALIYYTKEMQLTGGSIHTLTSVVTPIRNLIYFPGVLC